MGIVTDILAAFGALVILLIVWALIADWDEKHKTRKQIEAADAQARWQRDERPPTILEMREMYTGLDDRITATFRAALNAQTCVSDSHRDLDQALTVISNQIDGLFDFDLDMQGAQGKNINDLFKHLAVIDDKLNSSPQIEALLVSLAAEMKEIRHTLKIQQDYREKP